MTLSYAFEGSKSETLAKYFRKPRRCSISEWCECLELTKKSFFLSSEASAEFSFSLLLTAVQ